MAFRYYAREDSNSANNPALNLTNDGAVQLNFVKLQLGGNVTLETDAGGIDPDTMVEINGQSYNFTYEFSGEFPTSKNNGSQQVPDQFEGQSVVLITVHDYPSAGDSTRFALMPESGATQAEMDAFGNGSIDVQALNEDPPAMAVCFVRGTLIATPTGERPVEALRPGDDVLTADGRTLPLRWVATSHFRYRDLVASPGLRPVRIPRGWLGRGMPHSDLWVSSQHRIVLRGWQAELTLAREAVFIPAKHLMGEPGVPGPDWFGGVDYYHLLLDTHEVLLSNGLESESFLPGEEALKSLGAQARAELAHALSDPAPHRPEGWHSALTTATAAEARVLRRQRRRAA